MYPKLLLQCLTLVLCFYFLLILIQEAYNFLITIRLYCSIIADFAVTYAFFFIVLNQTVADRSRSWSKMKQKTSVALATPSFNLIYKVLRMSLFCFVHQMLAQHVHVLFPKHICFGVFALDVGQRRWIVLHLQMDNSCFI